MRITTKKTIFLLILALLLIFSPSVKQANAVCVPLPVCTCPPCVVPPWTPPPGNPSYTPYLFTYIDGQYVIENDIMSTYYHKFYDKARQGYENTPKTSPYLATDKYKLERNPTVTEEGIKFIIQEIEPEESHIDEIRLLRYVHPKNSTLFVDRNADRIQAVMPEKLNTLKSCSLNRQKEDCSETISMDDDTVIVGNPSDFFTVEFDISGLDKSRLYLGVTAWNAEAILPQNDMKSATDRSLEIAIVTDDNPNNNIPFKDIHPRELESTDIFYLGDTLDKLDSDTLKILIKWTAYHHVDQISLMRAVEVESQSEEINLLSVEHSNNTDELPKVKEKDFFYSHIVQGEELELTFDKPILPVGSDEKESYVFVASGFFHDMRSQLYPNKDTSDNWKKTLGNHVSELKKFLDQ